MSLFLTHCFPHASSCTDHYESDSEYECRDDLFDLNRFTQPIHVGLDLTIEGSRKLGHYLLIIMWRLILKSPMLFRVRDEAKEQVKLLEKFCCQRHEEFREVCSNHHLFEDSSVEVFDDMQVWASMRESEENETREYEGEKRIKLDAESLSKVYTLSNYFATIVKKYIFGELAKHGTVEIYKFITKQNKIALTFKIEELRDMVLKYFEYTPSMLPLEDQDVKLYFIGMTALLEYLAADMIELGGNAARDARQEYITPSCFEIATSGDAELERTVLFHMNHLPLVDFNYFYGANQTVLPPIDVNEKANSGEEFNFTQLPTELHHTILKNVSSLEELLEMRLVCKQWNYFIMNDNDIWKSLICNNMISEDLFRFCDSTFTVDELETILSRGKDLKPLHFGQQVINHFYEKNDWKSLYFILVRRHLTFIRDLDLMKSREFFDVFQLDSSVESYDNSKKKLQIGITKGLFAYFNFTKHLSSRVSSKVYIPKDALSEFLKFGNNYSLVGVIDFSKFSSFISCRLFPKNGLLYCFYHKINQADFLFFENYSLESEQLIEFEIKDKTFKFPQPINPYQVYHEQIVVNQPSCCPFFYLQQAQGHRSGCNLAPSVLFNNNEDRPETMIQSYLREDDDDNIVLLSDTLEESEDTFSIYISREDLILRKFENAKIEYVKPNY
ncbi:hypothetical protein NAEGRDRAFT_69196 [Naegleria gruberi]|uniref:F-box domain-containing protein n=1 Tax=Naegleria gruberi TaxID=5762 RepID=D2VJX6_NAEGR|nr:uncharacterized protein NAEGRDRAFT_69196 [Naegleria gruberi]EFC42767.1 hypothetical protein NAEGRDRAFT_69196 [Naegleria gruberi]|eukprot:XP_002675511.1 hypothetical protein NAEGRDRAFT_69196 [Naegleria gruberi strain NEG-M]